MNLGVLIGVGVLAVVSSVTLAAFDSFPICTFEESQWNPAISGDTVVWVDRRDRTPDDWHLNIYGHDLSTGAEFAISTAPERQLWPAISGNIIVWQDERNGNWDIYGYDLSTGTEFPISTGPADQRYPAIDGNIVVWADRRGPMYGYDLSTGTEFPLATENPYYAPSISGDTVVFRRTDGPSNYEIYGYDLVTSTEFLISTGAESKYDPSISGNTVVWRDNRNADGNGDIYGYDLLSLNEFPICTDPGPQSTPVVNGDIVVWGDSRRDIYVDDLYGYDLARGREFLIATDDGIDHWTPAISGKTVVWESEFGPVSDIYGADLRTPVADAGGPYTVTVGENLVLDASASWDLENDIVSFMWDLDDDGSFETDAGGEAVFSVSYAYLESLGLDLSTWNEIHVRVTDSIGLTGTAHSGAIPEPATLAMLALGGVVLLRRKRGYGGQALMRRRRT